MWLPLLACLEMTFFWLLCHGSLFPLVPGADRLPTGAGVWENTYLKLPRKLMAPRIHSLFTAQRGVRCMVSGESGSLLLSDLLSVCPVGVILLRQSHQSRGLI